jgi:stage II sporulation protein AB (anti-sigma F factor)
MQPLNEMKLIFESRSNNESFARIVAAAFVSQLDPTIEELTEIKTAVSEAVTNSIIHGYENRIGQIEMTCKLFIDSVEITIKDLGKGIEDVEQARQMLFTTSPENERSGMGFTVMETFMDRVDVISAVGAGTTVVMYKKFRSLNKTGEDKS